MPVFVRFWRYFHTKSSVAIPLRKHRFHDVLMTGSLASVIARGPLKGTFVIAQSKDGNQVLAALQPADFALLQPHLENVDLPLRRQLEQRDRPVEMAYFLDSGLASMVVNASANHNIEVGIVGKEGMTGLPILMGCDRPAYETFIQTVGSGKRIAAEKLRAAIEISSSLHWVFLRYANTLVTQMAYTALANGRYNIEERLARWLLMADDRADGRSINLTHEALALMLGARRASVTNALAEFQKRDVLNVKRGVIAIKDRAALEDAANGSYGIPEAAYRRLFGP
jgi:CRP-like cAMP-binding protein